jgi:hypothetical protein
LETTRKVISGHMHQKSDFTSHQCHHEECGPKFTRLADAKGRGSPTISIKAGYAKPGLSCSACEQLCLNPPTEDKKISWLSVVRVHTRQLEE